MGLGNRARLLASSDGGRRWSLRSRRPLSGLTFGNRSDGWALTDNPLGGSDSLLRSTDGGRSWSWVPNPCRRVGLRPVAVDRATRMRGWIVCFNQPASDDGAIFETRDAGRRWRLGAFGTYIHGKWRERGGFGGGDPAGLAMSPNGSGFLWQGGHGGAALLRTADGGRRWKVVTGFVPDQDFGLSGAMFSSVGGFFLAWRTNEPTNFSELLRTTDAGRHWTTVRRWKPKP